MDQIFNIHLVSDQEQVDLVVLEFEDYAMTWWHQLCMDNINQEPPAASGMDIKTLMISCFLCLLCVCILIMVLYVMFSHPIRL